MWAILTQCKLRQLIPLRVRTSGLGPLSGNKFNFVLRDLSICLLLVCKQQPIFIACFFCFLLSLSIQHTRSLLYDEPAFSAIHPQITSISNSFEILKNFFEMFYIIDIYPCSEYAGCTLSVLIFPNLYDWGLVIFIL